MKIKIDDGRLAAERGLPKHFTRTGEVVRHRLLGKYGLSQLQCADCDRHLQARQGGDGDRLHVPVFDQCAPVAVGFRHADVMSTGGRALCVTARERDDLTARVGPESRQLHGASIIAADYSQTDHVSKPAAWGFALCGMDLSQIVMLGKGELVWAFP